jgi:hypothetical protein
MSLEDVAIFLTALMAAFAVTMRAVGDRFHLEIPELIHFYVYVPTFLLACLTWLTRPRFLRSWPFLFATAIPVVGLCYGESPSLGTNAVVAFYLVSGVALAALIADRNRWRWAARVFVLVNAFLVFFIFWLNYQASNGSLRLTLIKYGYLLLSDMTKSANPNQVGAQFAFASVVGFVVFLRSGRLILPSQTASVLQPVSLVGDFLLSRSGTIAPQWWRFEHLQQDTVEPHTPNRRFEFGRADWGILAGTMVCALGCVLTASRGATLGLIVGASAAILGSLGLQPIRRVRDFVVFAVLAFLVGTLVAATLNVNPLERLSNRIFGGEGETVVTAGSRLQIWENAFRAWLADPVRFLVGAGTGGADVALGKFDPGAKFDDYGTIRRSCHNIFIEWALSYGLVGILPGVILALTVWSQAAALDRQEFAMDRRALLLTIATLGMTGVAYRYLSWPMMAGLSLALLEFTSGTPVGTFRAPTMQPPHWVHGPGWQVQVKLPESYQPISRWPI